MRVDSLGAHIFWMLDCQPPLDTLFGVDLSTNGAVSDEWAPLEVFEQTLDFLTVQLAFLQLIGAVSIVHTQDSDRRLRPRILSHGFLS